LLSNAYYDLRCDVVVAGGGITGLAAAAALSQQGFSVLVVEQRKCSALDRWGLTLWPSGIKALDAIGVLPQVLEEGCTLTNLQWIAERTGDWIPANLQDLRGNNMRFVGILPSVLENILSARAIANGTKMLIGAKILGAQQGSREGDVEVLAAVDAGTLSISSRILLIADGPNSPIRETLGIKARIRQPRRQVIFTGIAGPLPFAESRQAFGHMWSAGCVQVGQNRSWFYAVVQTPYQNEARMAIYRYAELDRTVSVALSTLGEVTSVHPTSVRVKRWALDLGLILGDAAHGMFPYLGFGGNASLEDIPVMSEVLCRALKTRGKMTDILQEMQKRREARVSYLRRASELFSMILTSRIPGASLVRDWNLRRLAAHPQILNRFIEEVSLGAVPSLRSRLMIPLP
jgi:2-polyprenyl-6-methoxyphenol hydroxylase-like FAD-dependent oxidoreductase